MTLVVGLSAAVASVSACGGRSSAVPARSASPPCGTYDGRGCAPASKRVDLARPLFSHSTRITNPLFPISRLRSALLLGHVDGKPFRTETTLLPGAKTVAWDGRRIRVRVSQYVAYLNGRLEEVALDRYAQADDGSVWYFGEDVFDYRNGAVAVTEGTSRARSKPTSRSVRRRRRSTSRSPRSISSCVTARPPGSTPTASSCGRSSCASTRRPMTSPA
jgi:hypothetical protein